MGAGTSPGTSPADPAAAADRTIPTPPGEGVTAVEASGGAASGDGARPARGADVRRGGDSGTGPEDGPGADAGPASGADAGSAPGSGADAGAGGDFDGGARGSGGGEPDSGAEGEGSDGNGSDRGPDDAVSAPAPDGAPRRSRRFPSFTRDTARPEGGGRAASGDAPAPARQWPLLAVLCTAGVGLLIVALNPFAEAFRIGTILIGAALVGGAVLRCVVPSVGMLAVRSRFTDLVTYGLLGVLIVMLALVAQPKPWLDIPFLEHAVRFTIR
ncbi:DUF3017 domain-containing protein [Streptomyces sp. NBC_00841]|uniref:DUF3017 domain-containing protein n=1 Tax=unclassified Streptomyces TaxID=2593676 RepID=UPI00224DC8A9|nr:MULTISPECIES: DUF3017 domain-containing protein [unclassified Streptomyces]MCX4533167.1 DUF3017 domain-containing protein [Streptomyces sp. NBC_01669]WSA01398.1 DUF3017 domain-containing protein [Streptomyces sp. NBC_00841]